MTGSMYVVITTARNEERYIANLVESVLSQTILPAAFVIVSDSSHDRTEEIAKSYESKNSILRLIRRCGKEKECFGSKALAIRMGMLSLKEEPYRFVSILDADITIGKRYFETLLGRMLNNAGIGICGGVVKELYGGLWVPLHYNYGQSVAGAVQMFRRECYERIGGYLPMAFGGIDSVAESMARMHGWEVKTFRDVAAHHHRPVGARSRGVLYAQLLSGKKEYSIGYSALFQLLRLFSRMLTKPYLVGSLVRTLGFFYSMIKGDAVLVPDALEDYLKREQLRQTVLLYRKLMQSAIDVAIYGRKRRQDSVRRD